MRDYSQYKESTILYEIFEKIGTINKYGVEFGASDGYWLSNLRMFLDLGWSGLQIDGIENPKNGVVREFITAENINSIFEKYLVPDKFDLLSIDIDGNDFWVWKEIKKESNVVIIEYNSNFDLEDSVVLKYDPEHVFDGTYGYSASLKALEKLGKSKGYYLYSEIKHTNLIFVKNEFYDILGSVFEAKDYRKFQNHRQVLNNKEFIKI